MIQPELLQTPGGQIAYHALPATGSHLTGVIYCGGEVAPQFQRALARCDCHLAWGCFVPVFLTASTLSMRIPSDPAAQA